jgi:hypothetical protein
VRVSKYKKFNVEVSKWILTFLPVLQCCGTSNGVILSQ